MKIRSLSLLIATAIAGGSACGTDSDLREPRFDTLSRAIENQNALNPNALNPNALNPNALNPNALNPNALNPNGLSDSALASLRSDSTEGALSRQLIQYLVSCAFSTNQSFSFDWTDNSGVVHHEYYEGLLGLAPSWANGALDEAGRPWVSACLASRVNWYGVHVTLSSRGSISALATLGGTEAATFDHFEGAFFGNVFVQTPHIYACRSSANADYSRSLQRDCAAGHLDANNVEVPCGNITLLGDCSRVCTDWNGATGYYGSCSGDGVAYAPVSVWLD